MLKTISLLLLCAALGWAQNPPHPGGGGTPSGPAGGDLGGTYPNPTVNGLIVNNALFAEFFGTNSGNSSSTGAENTAFGNSSGHALTAPALGATPQRNSLFGTNAGKSITTAREMTAIGGNACNLFVGNGQGVEDGLSLCIGSEALANYTGSLSTNTDIIAIGQKAFLPLTDGGFSICIGNHCANSINNALSSTILGNFAMGVAGTTTGTSTRDVIIGRDAAGSLTGAFVDNVAVGYRADFAQTAGTGNVAIGSSALLAQTTAGENTAIGHLALSTATTATNEVVVGSQSCQYCTGSNLVAIGTSALQGANAGTPMSGGQNVAVGRSAGSAITTGQNNTLIGNQAGQSSNALTTGSDNTIIGGVTVAAAATDNFEVVIGYRSVGHGSNTVTLGNATDTAQTWLYGAIVPGIVYSAAGTALPTCTSTLNGARAVVSDATAPTYLGAYTSGGALTTPVVCRNGTGWLTD